MKSVLSLAVLTALFCSGVSSADFAVRSPEGGTVQITVLNADGSVAADAPVYIYGMNKTRFVGGADIPGTTTFAMKEGEYRVSSAVIQRNGDYIDRFASNEAHFRVVPGDNVSVILTLNPVQNPEEQALSYGTLHVAGIPVSLLTN